MPGFVDTHRHTWQTAMRGDLRRLDADGVLPRDPDQHLAGVHGRRRVRRQLRRRARGARRRRHVDPRLLALQQQPGARRRRHRRPSRRRHPRGLRIRLLPCAGHRAGVRLTRPADRRRAAGAGGAFLLRRRPPDDGRRDHRDRPAAVGRHGRGGALGARARRAADCAHRLCMGLAIDDGCPRAARARPARRGAGARPLQRTLRRRAAAARRSGRQGVEHARDRAADGHGSSGDRPCARARDEADARMRHRLPERRRHVRPDAHRPSVRARRWRTIP